MHEYKEFQLCSVHATPHRRPEGMSSSLLLPRIKKINNISSRGIINNIKLGRMNEYGCEISWRVECNVRVCRHACKLLFRLRQDMLQQRHSKWCTGGTINYLVGGWMTVDKSIRTSHSNDFILQQNCWTWSIGRVLHARTAIHLN